MRTTLLYPILLLLLYQTATAQDMEQLAKKDPVSLHGNIGLLGIGYSATGITARRKPLSYMLFGNTSLTLYGLEIPVSFTLTEQDRNFSQPLNQFGLSPTYKWITVHAGYRNLSFSPYTLDGYTMLGVGLELNPKKFHFAIMSGRLNRATAIDTTLGTLQPFSFSRKGTAIKLGAGDEKNYFYVSVLRAKDDSTSVNTIDPITKQMVRPAANTVGSVAFRSTFAKHVFIEGDAGASLWTNDIGSNYAVPDSSEWVDKLRKVMPINGTSEFYTAYRAAAGFTSKTFSLKFEYKYIDPQFRSMGVYYFNNDIKSYTISPSFNLFKNKFRLSGSIGRQEDNVRQQKQSTTTRTIGMANLSWDITSKLGIDAGFTNFASNSKPTVVLVQNKYLLAQNNSNISFTPRYVFANGQYSHIVIASYNRSNLTDDNAATQTTNNITTEILLLNYTYTIVKRSLSITAAFNNATNTLPAATFKNNSYTLAFNKSWLKGKLTSALSNTYTNSKSSLAQTSIYNLMANACYQPSRHHRLSLRYTLLNNRPANADSTQINFAENTTEIGYTLSF